MRKEISPDMYNYNKFPGPNFIRFDNVIKSEDIQFMLIDNHKDAFKAEIFTQRYSDILLKYDYIVGDWGNEQLRLKGFYKSDRATDTLVSIDRFEDYLKEYCNFGCAYFILENPSPQEVVFEEETVKRRRRRRRKSSENGASADFRISKVDRRDKKTNSRSERTKSTKRTEKHFTIHQRD